MKRNMFIKGLFLISSASFSLCSMEKNSAGNLLPHEVYENIASRQIEDPCHTLGPSEFRPLLNLYLPSSSNTFYDYQWYSAIVDPTKKNILQANVDEESLNHVHLALKLAATMYVESQRFTLYGFCKTLRDNKEEILTILGEIIENPLLQEGKKRLAELEIGDGDDDDFSTAQQPTNQNEPKTIYQLLQNYSGRKLTIPNKEFKTLLKNGKLVAKDNTFTIDTDDAAPIQPQKQINSFNTKYFTAGCFTTLGIMSVVYALPKVYHWIRG